METFLIDKQNTYTYADLLYTINKDKVYRPLFKGTCLFQYFSNLVKALVCNQPLILLDSDLNFNEMGELSEKQVNEQVPLIFHEFKSIDEVIAAVQVSTSEITLFTSGTTGQPKKVIHTVFSLTRSVRISENNKGQIWGFAYNPTHMAGLQVFFQAFENKNTLVNIFGNSRTAVYQAIDNNQITHLSATPTFYRLLLPYEHSCPSVVRVTLGGEKSDQHLYKSISEIFPSAKINNIYASTEAGSLFAARGDCFQIPDSLQDKFRVEMDELLVHKSLLGQSDSFQFTDDYYHTGDLIEWVDKEKGLFRFKSRKNEFINVGGYKVNPEETENALLAIVGISQALVYGKANSVLGNILCADIKIEAGSSLTELEIRNQLKSNLQDFKIPRRIKFVESFALTRTGKMKRL